VTEPTTAYSLYVGIDISAQTFSAAWKTGTTHVGTVQEFGQKQIEYARLVKVLQATGHTPSQTLVVIEATGTYWMRLATYLYQEGFRVSVINPRQAYHFAQAMLKRAKTDAIDAQMLAHLAATPTLSLKVWQPPSEAWEALYQRLVERDSRVEIRQMLRNQRHALNQRTQLDPQVEARGQCLIDEVNGQIKAIDRELEAWLQRSEWADTAKYLRSVIGIGLLSTAWLLVITNGFSTCEDADQLASYLGLVPHPCQSGTSRRGYKHTGHDGHARTRGLSTRRRSAPHAVIRSSRRSTTV
jgi:transposase